jgi:hypothetical protein
MDAAWGLGLHGWKAMWALALGLYSLGKAASWRAARFASADWRRLAYLLAWPGMDAHEFVAPYRRPPAPSFGEWCFASLKLLLGVGLVFAVAPAVAPRSPLLAGWVGMIGCVLTLHFGLFHLLACWWRSLGLGAAPLMDWPFAARSVGEFWGRRWNRAFRDLAHGLIFRPLEPKLGARGALAAGFLISGLIHELVISFPAGTGYGGPTAYFLLQAVGIAVQRSSRGQKLGLRHGLLGRAFAALVILGPLGLLFPSAFVLDVFLPFLIAIGALP